MPPTCVNTYLRFMLSIDYGRKPGCRRTDREIHGEAGLQSYPPQPGACAIESAVIAVFAAVLQ